MTTNAYKTTSVPVAKSQEAISKMLRNFGAMGVQFTQEFEERKINIRFAKKIGDQLRTVSVSMVVPEAPQPKRKRTRSYRYRGGRMIYDKLPVERQEQMERATYRALHDWLKSQFVAIEYGLLTFEDVFLSHFEWMIDGKQTTIGAVIKPRLELDSKYLLDVAKSEKIEHIDGIVEE